MKLIKFSDCDDYAPNGTWIDDFNTQETAENFVNNTGLGLYIAYDDTGESEKTGQGPYYVFQL